MTDERPGRRRTVLGLQPKSEPRHGDPQERADRDANRQRRFAGYAARATGCAGSDTSVHSPHPIPAQSFRSATSFERKLLPQQMNINPRNSSTPAN